MDVIVTRKRLEAQDIATFELAAADGAPLPPFSAGSHIDVHLGDRLVRQYSLCNNPEERHRYLIGVLRDPASRGGSVAMHDQVQEGDRLQISEPRNHFPLAHEAKRSILFAGGIGITPILCMAERLSRIGAPVEIHYCTRTRSRTAFYERITAAPFGEAAQFHFDDGPPEQKLAIDAVLGRVEPDTHLYVCGPAGFMAFVLGAAERLGWPAANVHREYFAAAPAEPAADSDSFTVRIASTGQVIRVAAEQSVLAALTAHGIEIPVSCEAGVCGTCLTRVLQGTPDHRDMFMTDEEHARNDQFTPCCSRSLSPELVLDL